MNNSKIVEFTGTITSNPCNNSNWKIYGMEIDKKKYPNIKVHPRFNNVTIVGNIHELGIGLEYEITAEEVHNEKYGYQYKIANKTGKIRRSGDLNLESTKIFLSNVLTEIQAESLLSAYPDIVDRIINDKLDDINLKKVHGVKEKRFEVVKRKVIENFALADLVETFQNIIDFNTLQKLNERYTSVKKIKQALREEPYKCLCQLSRIGFKTADSKIIELDETCKKIKKSGKIPPIYYDYDIKTSKERAIACILYLLRENESNGNTRIIKTTLQSQAKKLAPACYSYFNEIIEDEDNEVYYDKFTKSISIKSTYEKERNICETIYKALQYDIEWDFPLEKYRHNGDATLTDEQFGLLPQICEYNVSILNGNGGSGKSATTESAIKMIKDNKKTFLLISPTGRAAKVLSNYTKEEAFTIHRGLRLYGDDEYNEDNKLNTDIVIIDEASMIDVELMNKIVNAIDFKRTKLLIVGDSAQIPSVGAGNILHDLINSKMIPLTTLTKIFRYGIGGQMTVATKIRNGEKFLTNSPKVQSFGEDKGYTFIPASQENTIARVCQLYSKLLETKNPEDIFVLSAYNKGAYGTVELNKRLQRIANKKSHIESDGIKFGDTIFFKDDLVIQTVNNYKARVYKDNIDNGSLLYIEDKKDLETFVPNGEIGTINKTDSKSNMIIGFDDVVIYDRENLKQLKLAYSISLHKSQGGQCPIVILITPKAHTFFLNANLLYVGATRATERVYHIGEQSVVDSAIKKKADFNRKTFLKELLINQI